MGNDSENQSQSNPQNHKKKFVEDVLMELPYAKAIRNYFFREGKAFYDGFLVFAILAGLIGWFAALKGYEYGAKNLESTKGELKDAKQDRDKYQLMLAPFQAMAIQVYTNIPIDKRLDYLAAQFSSVSSNLTATLESQNPSFQLYCNDKLITNGSVISLKNNRTVGLTVRNTSPVTAEHVAMQFMAPSGLAVSNLIGNPFWQPINAAAVDNVNMEIHKSDLVSDWEWKANDSIPGYGLKEVNSFDISTNMNWPVIGGAVFKVYADRSKCQEFVVTLEFE